MSYIARLMALESYRQALTALERREADRIYCKHDLDHFLDVARITLLLCQAHNIEADRDSVYLAALMHDLGRLDRDEADHNVAGSVLAAQWLDAIGFPKDRQEVVLTLIEEHGWPGKKAPANLSEAFSLADSYSRACYYCPAADSCFWPPERKNTHPIY